MKTSFKFILPIDDVVNLIKGYCGLKGFNVGEKEIQGGKSLDVSNLKDKIPINIYQSGTVVLQGKDCELKTTLGIFLEDAEANPAKYLKQQVISAEAYKARTTVYKLASQELQLKIEDLIMAKGDQIIDLKPCDRTSIKYRKKLKRFQFEAVITQYDNGTLVIQGRNNNLWDDLCTIIEQSAQLEVNKLAARFVSNSEEDAKNIINLLTDELIFVTKNELRTRIGEETYNFLDEWDRKYLTSSLCLLHLNLLLPEYSSVVMPASKSFEGFLKKLLVEIDLTTKSEIQKAGWDFGQVWRKEKYNDYVKENNFRRVELVKLENALSRFRNYMMHSSGAVLTQVIDNQDAESRVEEILQIIKDAYQFFIIRKGES